MPKNALCRKVEPIGEWTIMGKTFTVYGSDTEPLILAKDVAAWIEYAKTSQGKYDVSNMMKLVDEDEKVIREIEMEKYVVRNRIVSDIQKYVMPTKEVSDAKTKARKTQSMWFVKEDGLYELLMLNRTEQGKKFKKEVKKILKHLREDGAYIVHKKDDSWNKLRIGNKETRKEFTDILKQFVAYARGQGSQHADRYYKIFTDLIRNKLSIPDYLTKDGMSEEVLSVLNHYEFIVGRYILSQIEAKCPYKEVYQGCKKIVGQV